MIKIKSIIQAGKVLKVLTNNSNDSGINDISEIIIITPAEKAKEKEITNSLLLFLIKHGIRPNRVENPAKVVIAKLNITFFIFKTMFLKKKYAIA